MQPFEESVRCGADFRLDRDDFLGTAVERDRQRRRDAFEAGFAQAGEHAGAVAVMKRTGDDVLHEASFDEAALEQAAICDQFGQALQTWHGKKPILRQEGL